MNWDDMRLFLGLARNGRVAIAAKGLKVDPTTLIRRVKKLEDSLNCNLFELTKKGYVLTSQGSELVRYIEKAEHYFLEAQNELSDERSHLAGTIRVSVSEGFGSWFLAPLLPDFKAQYPGICIELVATSGFLNLNKREADMAILLEKPSKGLLVTQKLTDYELYLYTHETLVQSAKPKSLHDLRHFNLVSYVPDLVYAPQLKFIEETALSQLSALRSTSINAQHQMLVNGAGVGILPKFIAEHQAGLVRLLQQDIHIKRTFWLASHKETYTQAKFQAFSSWLLEKVQFNRSRFVE
ncbi:LysR family transcriptional regulator [Alteromonas sp. KUL42]|uniref:LysR family transcriptional regulator n=1 Tax=Alteromonas sp. KUL42 TaxID=2480797 RepID=UPI000792054E|nr:LysR family transcriptional regulator [Alteromonas sp. KUL42]KXJ61700.1 MAG: transcriptional regulator [Alteromonas sp. Nap_26]TAP34001.1 LysR family transcriptional regulator [Alteromonas sp. KUL42]GEA08056.1 LysR family transcriptional regulator [Alteromonas sp. KUL42]